MTKSSKVLILLLRLAMGGMFLYQGIDKIRDSSWTAAGLIAKAETLRGFFQWLLSPEILPIVNIMTEWGMLLLGVSLIFGAFVRLSTILGALMMALFYLAVLKFPYAANGNFLIDIHVIYGLLLLYLGSVRSGRYWGFDGRRDNYS